MKKTLLLVIALIGFSSYAQDLTCEDFKNGTFKVIITEPIEVDWKIVRKGNEQIELVTEIPQEFKDSGYSSDPQYGLIKWIDDCTYQLTYDTSKLELSDSQKLINSLGGVLTEMIKIEGKCFYYKSTLKFEDGEQVINGKFCKE